MAGETSKARARRQVDGWFTSYLVGTGIDIGAGPDPVTPDCRIWDMPDGDAQKMEGVQNESFDYVYSSHCLEHVVDPVAALQRWWELVKVGGHLIVEVPDEDLYEQGCWPLRFNVDHKSTWTIHKLAGASWSPVSHNLQDLLRDLPGSEIKIIRICDTNYRPDFRENGNLCDQTSAPWAAEASIEAVVRKAYSEILPF